MPLPDLYVADLLRIYHHGPDRHTCLRPPNAAQAQYLNDVGLGPIANSIYGRLLETTDSEIYLFLKSADLTIRTIYRQMADATGEILTKLADSGITPTLIKGISTADEYYAPSHFRVMGDVDILVDDSESHASMEIVKELRYETSHEEQRKYESEGHHHLPIARHPDTGVCVEVHTRLFSPRLQVSREPLFQPDAFRLEKRDSTFGGQRVARFSPEFQLAFTVSKWAIDDNWAANLTSINDVIHILRRHGPMMNQQILQKWLATTPTLYANMAGLLNYLARNCIYAPEHDLREMIAQSESEMPPRVLGLLRWLLHKYPFNAYGKIHSGYARRRAHMVWSDLTAPGRKDRDIPWVFLRTFLKSLHHGKYNPLNMALSLARALRMRLPAE